MTAIPQAWMQHVFRPSGWNAREQTKMILLLSGFLVLLAGVVYVIQISAVASKRHELDELLAYRDSLMREVELLKEEITTRQNIVELQKRATRLGFQYANSDEIRYIRIEQILIPDQVSDSSLDGNQYSFLEEAELEEASQFGWLKSFERQWNEFTHP